MDFWKVRWIYMLLGVIGGIGFALYHDFEPFSLGVALGAGLITPLTLIIALGISALVKEGHAELESRSLGLFLGAGVPVGCILGSFL